MKRIQVHTEGEQLYDITSKVQDTLAALIPSSKSSGVLYLFVVHTSCALTISEGYDPTARQDVEAFLRHLAPRNLSFIRHTLEGSDDSPSHMKSILLQPTLTLLVEKGQVFLGRWQSVYLAEFRDRPHERQVAVKFTAC